MFQRRLPGNQGTCLLKARAALHLRKDVTLLNMTQGPKLPLPSSPSTAALFIPPLPARPRHHRAQVKCHPCPHSMTTITMTFPARSTTPCPPMLSSTTFSHSRSIPNRSFRCCAWQTSGISSRSCAVHCTSDACWRWMSQLLAYCFPGQVRPAVRFCLDGWSARCGLGTPWYVSSLSVSRWIGTDNARSHGRISSRETCWLTCKVHAGCHASSAFSRDSDPMSRRVYRGGLCPPLALRVLLYGERILRCTRASLASRPGMRGLCCGRMRCAVASEWCHIAAHWLQPRILICGLQSI